MLDKLANIHPTSIAAAIEANTSAYLLSFARLPDAVLHDHPQCVWVDSGVADATFNSVVSTRFDPITVDSQIESVLSHFRQRSRPVTWHVGPSTEPTDLGTFLVEHGMVHVEDEPGMAVEIAQMRQDAGAHEGFAIETVCDEKGLEEWVSVWLFPVPVEVRRLYFDALRLRGLGEDLPWRYYIGRLDGAPVATSELFIGEGVAAVQHVVTLPGVRRRGIGSAMTLRVLREARALGYRVAVLTASPSGIGVYRSLGFREYCLFSRYEWEPRENETAN